MREKRIATLSASNFRQMSARFFFLNNYIYMIEDCKNSVDPGEPSCLDLRYFHQSLIIVYGTISVNAYQLGKYFSRRQFGIFFFSFCFQT